MKKNEIISRVEEFLHNKYDAGGIDSELVEDCVDSTLEAINYTHSYILGDLKDKTKMEIPKLIEREDEFCESIDCERTEDTRQFIYDSRNDKSVMNLPYVLLEYKQWLIDEGFIKELK